MAAHHRATQDPSNCCSLQTGTYYCPQGHNQLDAPHFQPSLHKEHLYEPVYVQKKKMTEFKERVQANLR